MNLATIVKGDAAAAVTVTVTNSIRRDVGSLKILKTVSNPDGATLPATFTVNYTCGALMGSVSVASGSPATVSDIPTGTTCTVTEVAPAPIPNFTWGTITYTPASATINTKGGTFEITVGNSITRDRGEIVIIKNAQPQQGSFAFATTGTGYNAFVLTGATANSGNRNTQTLVTGNYTVTESTQLGWILTGIGGGDAVNPNDVNNTKFYCTVSTTGSKTSSGIGDLLTQKVEITLGKNDTVTCVFENTGQGVTRTQGFWATHTPLAKIAWFGGTFGTHTFPGVAAALGDRMLCTRALEGPAPYDISKVMGGFWSDISKTTTNSRRSSLDQARMQLLQQLLAAELNASAFGSGSVAAIAGWEAAYCGTNEQTIKNAASQAAAFNSAGDSGTFTPGTSADSKNARTIANQLFWDTLP